jgi:hypothetical protein
MLHFSLSRAGQDSWQTNHAAAISDQGSHRDHDSIRLQKGAAELNASNRRSIHTLCSG